MKSIQSNVGKIGSVGTRRRCNFRVVSEQTLEDTRREP